MDKVLTAKFIRSLNACHIPEDVVKATWGEQDIDIKRVPFINAPIIERYYALAQWCTQYEEFKALPDKYFQQIRDWFVNIVLPYCVKTDESFEDKDVKHWTRMANKLNNAGDIEACCYGLCKFALIYSDNDVEYFRNILVAWVQEIRDYDVDK